MVHRSARSQAAHLPTGAIVAAPTGSLPGRSAARAIGTIGTAGPDAAFTVYGLIRIGFTEEAEAFIRWLAGCVGTPTRAQAVYHRWRARDRGGRTVHLDGCRLAPGIVAPRIDSSSSTSTAKCSTPSIWNKYGAPVFYDPGSACGASSIGRQLGGDRTGIWEVRGGAQHFTYSKLMLGRVRSGAAPGRQAVLPADRARWLRIRDEVYETSCAGFGRRAATSCKRGSQARRPL
jgi:GH15 family glucan-1,4-alpha-glucosidase